MHARFRFQPAIGIVARDLVGGAADAGLVARGFGQQFDLIALLLGPAHIHPRQHRRPVAAFRAARARVDLQEGVVGIGLAVQQGLQFLLGGHRGQRLQVRLGFRDQIRVALGLAQFDHLGIGGQIALDAGDRCRWHPTATAGRASASARGRGPTTDRHPRSWRSSLPGDGARSASQGAVPAGSANDGWPRLWTAFRRASAGSLRSGVRSGVITRRAGFGKTTRRRDQ